jgi:hypothetical protein
VPLGLSSSFKLAIKGRHPARRHWPRRPLVVRAVVVAPAISQTPWTTARAPPLCNEPIRT